MRPPLSRTEYVLLLFLGTATAQDYSSSTSPIDVSAYRQAAGNISEAFLMPFACHNETSHHGNSYAPLDLGPTSNRGLITAICTSVFEYFLYSTFPFTNCAVKDVPEIPLIDVSDACLRTTSSQVNYAVEFQILYTCTEEVPGIIANTLASLRATASLSNWTRNNLTSQHIIQELVVNDVWFYQTPEVQAFNGSADVIYTPAAQSGNASSYGSVQYVSPGHAYPEVIPGFSVNAQELSLGLG